MYIQPISQVVCRVWEDPETVHLYVPWWFETFSDQEQMIHFRKTDCFNGIHFAPGAPKWPRPKPRFGQGPKEYSKPVMQQAKQILGQVVKPWTFYHFEIVFQHPTVWWIPMLFPLYIHPCTLGPQSGTSRRWWSRMRSNPKSDHRSMSVSWALGRWYFIGWICQQDIPKIFTFSLVIALPRCNAKFDGNPNIFQAFGEWGATWKK